MNRFEQAVYDCMIPTAELLEQTTNPLHRAMLLNFWRHVHLEGSAQFERITASDMIVDHPVYRVAWGANPAVIEGKGGVLGFYNSVDTNWSGFGLSNFSASNVGAGSYYVRVRATNSAGSSGPSNERLLTVGNSCGGC